MFMRRLISVCLISIFAISLNACGTSTSAEVEVEGLDMPANVAIVS